MYRSPSGSWKLPYVLLVAMAAFALGVFVEREGWLPTSRPRPPAHLGHTFDPFWEAWGLVEKHYVDREAVDPARMTAGAIDGMLGSLGDEGHTTYLTREEAEEFDNALLGQLEGIGVRMTERHRRPTVASVLPGTPAQQAGLRPGDVLLQVNDRDVLDLSLERISALVRGPAGTAVRLKVAREGEAKPLDLEVTRAKIDLPDVTWHMLPGVPVAHVAIEGFDEPAHDQLLKALREAREKGAKGLILDVRGNPGGLKDQAVAVTSEFLKDGVVFIEQDADGVRTPVAVQPGGHATDIPVCVLIDEGTASSAEIFAGALQDHGRGVLVGATTFGTGTVLQPFDLKDGSELLLAVAQWFTPNGRKIWHQGIEPDVKVALPEGASILLPEAAAGLDAEALAKSEDKQLLKALEVLQEKLR